MIIMGCLASELSALAESGAFLFCVKLAGAIHLIIKPSIDKTRGEFDEKSIFDSWDLHPR